MKLFLRRILGIGTNQHPIDPAKFGDPLALKTEWTPATKGGTNFRTHKLVEIDTARVEFKPAAAAKAFFSLFILIALAMIFGIWAEGASSPGTDADIIMPILILGGMVVVGGILLYNGTRPIVFDKGVGYFWKGRKTPQDVMDVSSLKNCVPLDQIHALQLVSEWVHSGKSSYYSYELNLVLEDARRMTVIDHGNLVRLREDAQKLSEFLEKPIWDAIDR